MSPLFPLYLAAGAAVVAPIIMHLRRRPPTTKVEFSSLLFLSPTPLVTTTRRKLENWLLLLLRCLALILLAAMFSRPFLADKEGTQAQGRAFVLLVDRSASMQHADQWKKALAKLKDSLSRLTPQDRVAVGAFDQSLHRVVGFTQLASRSAAERYSIAETQLNQQGCGWLGTDLGRALVDAVSWFNESVQGEASHTHAAEQHVVLITDLQEGASLDALRGFAWPENTTVVSETISASNTDNLSLGLVAADPSAEEIKDSPTLRVRLGNARDSRAENYKLKWAGSNEVVSEGHLPAGATRVLRLPRVEDAQHRVLEIAGDQWSFDNALNLAPPQPRQVNIACLAGHANVDETASPMFYLQRALRPTSRLAPALSFITKPAELTAATWAVAVADVEDIKLSVETARWVEQGGQLLCMVPDNANVGFLNTLLDTTATLTEASVKDYALLSTIDFTDPILRPFTDARLHDFTKIHFWHYRKLVADLPKASVIAKFDNGDPAWLAVPRGKGRVILMLSGWQPRDSQLALSSKFVPLLFGMLAEAGVTLDEPVQFVVGEKLPVPADATLQGPDGKDLADAHAMKPGFYTVRTKDSLRTFAVNLAPEESRIAPMDMTRLTSLGVKLERTASPGTEQVKDRERVANEELESRQQYWLIALALLLWVLGVETWLAGKKATLEPLTHTN